MVSAADGSIAALLGASPGASTSVSIMIELIRKCFKQQAGSNAWQEKLKEMIPSFGKPLNTNPALSNEVRAHTSKVLGLVQ